MWNKIRNFFGFKDEIYKFKFVESGSDSSVVFKDDNNIKYILDLDWHMGVMDIEFGVVGQLMHDTTNVHNQYKILRTITHITKLVIVREGITLNKIIFMSSNWRGGDIDFKSGDIRNRFFCRYILKEYPKSVISLGRNNLLTINIKMDEGI